MFVVIVLYEQVSMFELAMFGVICTSVHVCAGTLYSQVSMSVLARFKVICTSLNVFAGNVCSCARGDVVTYSDVHQRMNTNDFYAI